MDTSKLTAKSRDAVSAALRNALTNGNPSAEPVHLPRFIEKLRTQVDFAIDGTIPDQSLRFDPAQFEQALLNLLKNAHESGSSPDAVSMAARRIADGWRIDVLDRGTGMNESRPEGLDMWKHWRDLTANVRGNLFFIPPDIIDRHTPRILDGAQLLCEQMEMVRSKRQKLNKPAGKT